MDKLSVTIQSSFKSALRQMGVLARRNYAAELCDTYYGGSSRKMERELGCSRSMIEKGQGERRTGILCSDRFSERGRKKKEQLSPSLIADVDELLSPETQSERCHRHTKGYVKITASKTKELLTSSKGYAHTAFCVRTVNNLLNRLGYSLKKVRKTLPLKRIAETDLIFENIKCHRRAKQAGILQISLDVKDKVKIGQLSRKGKHRQKQHVKALDKDQHWEETLVPLGILEIGSGIPTVILGDSYETSDFIIDGLELWYEQRKSVIEQYHTLEIYLDNGPQVESGRTQFINRIMEFACITGLNIHLLYYPPYHSKYNPIERVWAAIEQYWNGTLLETAQYTANTIENVTWKGYKPTVLINRKQYEQGVKLTPKEMKLREQFLIRKQEIPYWDVLIKPSLMMGMLFFA